MGIFSIFRRAQPIVSGEFIDLRDNQTYRTVTIGRQTWMAENLRATIFRDGTSLARFGIGDRASAGGPYADDPKYVHTYGLLYNGYAIEDARGLCPGGWHIPSDEEWRAFETHIGLPKDPRPMAGVSWRGTGQGNLLKEVGTVHWKAPNADASDAFGFCARPGGFFESSTFFVERKFKGMGEIANFWSSSQHNSDNNHMRRLVDVHGKILRSSNPKDGALSVRCIKDD